MFSRATTPGPVGNPEPRTVTETPHLSRLGIYTLQSGVRLEDKRTVICEEAGQSVPLVTVDYFLDSVAPELRPEINVGAVLQNLREHGDIVGDRWTLFPSDPEESDKHENITFKPFEKLVQTIASASACDSVRRRTLKVVNNPYRSPRSSHRNNSSRPDSYAILTVATGKTSGRPLWIDIGSTGEFKKGNAEIDRVDNAQKITWSMHHCMVDDPRRRFTFGWTIENTEMRLWHCNRSKRLVTHAFNFVEEHKYLVHFFLSLIYADPHELGWDPTMVIVDANKGKEAQYDITVRSEDGKDRVYRTLKMLSNVGAEAVQGRGTRVWLVVRNTNGQLGTEQVVLKDSWIDHDRMREGRILCEIIGVAHTKELGPFVRNMFLSVECHGDVYVRGRPDHTREVIMRGHRVPAIAPRYSLQRASTLLIKGALSLLVKTGMVGNAGLTIRHAARKVEPLDFDDKVHYRIVFKEQCKQIREETSVQKIFFYLGQIVCALKAMHECGWVHRDISITNILVDDQGLAKLADVEYAKRIDDLNSHSVRTGSIDFKAAELDTHEYMFLHKNRGKKPRASDSESKRHDHFGDLVKAVFMGKSQNISKTPTEQTVFEVGMNFRHNPIHDMESIWWSATHMMAGNEVFQNGEEQLGTGSDNPILRAQKQKELAGELSNDRPARNGIIIGNARLFHEIVNSLHPRMLPIAIELEKLRENLVLAYETAELNPESIDNTAADGLYSKFIESFVVISNNLKDADISLRPFKEPLKPAQKSDIRDTKKKRTRQSESAEDLQTISPQKKRKITVSIRTTCRISSIGN